MKKFYWQSMLVCGLLFPLIVCGQQQALYTQYMFNGLAINPAYAGTSGSLSLTALARWQWAGLEGAPTTKTFSAHAPVNNKHIGLGLTVSVDEIAVSRQTGVYGAYAYRIEVGGGYLSMGVQGGFTAVKADYEDVYLLTPDPTFQQQYSQLMPNVGGGLYYYTDRFYAGLSSPLLLQNKVERGGDYLFTQRRHYFFTGGVLFNLSESVEVTPSVLVKAIEGSPVSADYNVNFLFKELVGVGVSYRPPESIDFLMELNLTHKFRFGYAYDYMIEPTLRGITNSSHEVLLNYRLDLSKDNVTGSSRF